jgi:ribosomal protein S2
MFMLITKMHEKIIIQRANKTTEYVVELKYLGATLTDQKYIHKVKNRFNFGNAHYHSVL